MDLAQQQYIESLDKYESNHLGNFRRIYPGPGTDKYEKFFHSSGTLFQETAAFKARSELARYDCNLLIFISNYFLKLVLILKIVYT